MYFRHGYMISSLLAQNCFYAFCIDVSRETFYALSIMRKYVESRISSISFESIGDSHNIRMHG